MTNPKILIPLIRQVMPQVVAQQIIGVQPMTSSSGSIFSQRMRFSSKVYNRKYWPHQYRISVRNMTEAERWCWDNFRGRYWHSDYEQFVFKRSEDAVLFALRWT